MSNELKQLRDSIDIIDTKLLKLINQRAKLAKQAAKVKLASKLSELENKSNKGKLFISEQIFEETTFYMPAREAEVLKNIEKQNEGPLENKMACLIFREIMSACLALEKIIQIGYLGPKASFSHAAAIRHFGSFVKTVPLNSLVQVFEQVVNKQLDYGIVPIENSLGGVVAQTQDLLLKHKTKVCGELNLEIKHCLLAKTNDINSIKKVYAHQQSFLQCEIWLKNNLVNAELIEVASNSIAAKLVEDSGSMYIAAIASEQASMLYNLKILEKNIQDQMDNTTKFWILGHDTIPQTGNDKSALIIFIPNKSGCLFRILKCFAEKNINLTRIISVPCKINNWEYAFFIDIDGHIEDTDIKAVMQDVSDIAQIKILGSFPKFQI